MRIVFFVLLFFATHVRAETGINKFFKVSSQKSSSKSIFTKSNFFVGHSLSQTSYTLPKGKWMVGTFALGYGVHDNLTVGTSPWLLTIYNMPNILLRSKFNLSTSTSIGVHTGYMRTARYLKNEYAMELLYGNLIFSTVLSRSIRTHFQLNAMNFINEARPFSIRVSRPTDPIQLSLSNISEISVFDRKNEEWGVGVEFGYLGVNETRPYMHGGASVYRKTQNLLLQLGVSLSASNNVGVSDFAYVGRGNLPPGGEFREILTHPEIQIQYYF